MGWFPILPRSSFLRLAGRPKNYLRRNSKETALIPYEEVMNAMTQSNADPNPAPEHPVQRKLRDQILPWLESGKLLHKQWFYRLYVLFGYATDVTIALGAFGISLPLMT